MYQRSRKILIFLILVSSAVTIACGGIIIKSSTLSSSGKLKLQMKDWPQQTHAVNLNARRNHYLWQISMRFHKKLAIPASPDLGGQHGMGGYCTLSCSRDCSQTHP